MEILTADQMRRVDRKAIDSLGVPGLRLMETAGRRVAESLVEDYPDAASRGVLVICGKGNNGGDGLVAARHLLRFGAIPTVVLLAEPSALSADAAHQYRAAHNAGLRILEIDRADALPLDPASDRRTLILDAILGTGVRGGARGLAGEVIERLNRSGHPIVSIDLPSGLDADGAPLTGQVIQAQRTYTLCRPKLALTLDPWARLAGTWRRLRIGIPDVAVEAEGSLRQWFDRDCAERLMPRRDLAAHKGNLGHLLAVAGSLGKSGAAVLLGRGALRTGVGLVTVATPASALATVAVQQAELMTYPLPETDHGGLADAAAGCIAGRFSRCDALALGPGLGEDDATRRTIRAVLAATERPTVLDADGLNAFSGSPQERALLVAGGAPLVLTPHPGEAGRLLNCTAAEIQSDRLSAACTLADRTGAVVVLKGRHTLVASADGRVSINASGNPGMATAGCGDVLTGVLGALLARGIAAWDAARLAVFIHGDAGDRAAARRGEEGLIATDLVEQLPAALVSLRPTAP